MDGFVGPVEIHVVFAGGIADGVKGFDPLRLVANVLGLKEEEHAEAVDGVLSGRGYIDVVAERQFLRLVAPGGEPVASHSAVPRLVVSPACGIADPFPRQYGGEGAEDNAARLDCPNLVQVTDGRAKLKAIALAVRVAGIDIVWPVEAGEVVVLVTRWLDGHRVRTAPGKGLVAKIDRHTLRTDATEG